MAGFKKRSWRLFEPVAPPGTMPDGTAWPATYTRGYVADGHGTAVYQPEGWRASEGGELEIATRMAANGYDVALRKVSEAEGVRTADAYLIRDGVSESWEFKRTSEGATNIVENIRLHFRDGNKQAPNVVVYIDRDDVSQNDIWRAARGAVSRDIVNELRQLGTIDRSGILRTWSRAEVKDHGEVP